MYRLINNNVDRILAEIRLDRDLYRDIQHTFAKVNVATDLRFQRKYRQYWRLNAGRLSDSFCQIYFELLEESKRAGVADVEDIARRLMAVPANLSGRLTLQFSFASKL